MRNNQRLQLLSSEPVLLDMIDNAYKEFSKVPRTTLGLFPREEIAKFVLDYAKDIAVWCRRRENIVSTLGWVLSVEVWEGVVASFRGEE